MVAAAVIAMQMNLGIRTRLRIYYVYMYIWFGVWDIAHMSPTWSLNTYLRNMPSTLWIIKNRRTYCDSFEKFIKRTSISTAAIIVE